MRIAVLAVAVTLAWSGGAAAARPMHIMSLNLCTDQLLLDLVPPQRIASVTDLARSPSDSYLWRRALRVPVNHGLAEEVLVARPDLILAGTYTTTAARTILKKWGAPILEVDPAANFDDIRSVTRRVARAVGEPERGEALLRVMDANLRALAATRPHRVIRVAGWDGSGYVPGQGTLFDAILTVAGGTNIAASVPGASSGSFDIEQLLTAHPDLLAYGADSIGIAGRRTDTDQHPLVLKVYANRRITYPEGLFSCGVPETAEAARQLRASMLAAMARKGAMP